MCSFDEHFYNTLNFTSFFFKLKFLSFVRRKFDKLKKKILYSYKINIYIYESKVFCQLHMAGPLTVQIVYGSFSFSGLGHTLCYDIALGVIFSQVKYYHLQLHMAWAIKCTGSMGDLISQRIERLSVIKLHFEKVLPFDNFTWHRLFKAPTVVLHIMDKLSSIKSR